MQEVFSLCLSSSPHPSPIVFSFDAVGERPAQSISNNLSVAVCITYIVEMAQNVGNVSTKVSKD